MFADELILPQDLHIHTTFSSHDSAVVPEQTLELIAKFRHAKSIGISDHLDNIIEDNSFDKYEKKVRSYNFHLGVEVDGAEWVSVAKNLNVDYYIYHCHNQQYDYAGVDDLLSTNKPVIIAHPNALETNLDIVNTNAFVEINNRYIWRCNWKEIYGKYVDKFRFVINSDAHQPHWLNQNIARKVAKELGVKEHLLFK
jgi:histidinol phosphatase-like PHP family hydrolase